MVYPPLSREQYLQVRKQIQNLKRMRLSAVVKPFGFPVRVRWALHRLLPAFASLENELRDQAGKLLAGGKTVRSVSEETGLPRRLVEQVSKQFRQEQWARALQLRSLNASGK